MKEWVKVDCPPKPNVPILIKNEDDGTEIRGVFLDGDRFGYYMKVRQGVWGQVHATHWSYLSKEKLNG